MGNSSVSPIPLSGTTGFETIYNSGVAARVFEWGGGQKVDKILNLPHCAWMIDKIVRPKELLIPPKTALYSTLYIQCCTLDRYNAIE